MDDEILTPAQAAHELGVNLATVYRMIARGAIKHQRLGRGKGILLIRRGDLAEATLPTRGRPAKE